MDATSENTKAGFQIFRAGDAQTLDEAEVMTTEPMSEAVLAGTQEWAAAGDISIGGQSRMVFVSPGMSLMRIWFKSDYLLPRHAHNVDCLYFLLAGSLDLGSEALKAGDGFFVPAEISYAYQAGPKGVELLEFRACSQFNLRMMAGNPAFWRRAADTLRAKRDVWPAETRPSDVLMES